MADTDTIPATTPEAPKATVVTEAAIWQAIAYATHHDMPAPASITLFPQGTHRPHLELGVRSIEDAERWIEWLDLEGMHSIVFPREDDERPGFTSWRGMWGGWSWNIRAYHPDAEPENGPGDDTPSVTAAGQIHWECQQPDCTTHIVGPDDAETEQAIDAHLDEHLDAEGERHYADADRLRATIAGARDEMLSPAALYHPDAKRFANAALPTVGGAR